MESSKTARDPQEGSQLRLSRQQLASLPSHVTAPVYAPEKVSPGILHIGAGNFALAHVASYVHDTLAVDPSWGIVATSIRTDSMVAALRKHDGLYVMIERENGDQSATVMAPVIEALYGPDDPAAIVNWIADPRIRMVTITVSNKGYYMAASGGLDVSHHDIVHDIGDPDVPQTIYWYITRGLALRSQLEGDANPLTILSLDNVESNGRSFRTGLLQFVGQTSPELAGWIDDHVATPVTLVDRITPATTAEFRSTAEDFLGFSTGVVVGTEKFRHLVVERSPFPVPAWEDSGVETVEDCSPYWQRKFFCLNAGHQIVAIPALRLGITYIHEAMARDTIEGLLELAHREFVSFLPGEGLPDYTAAIRQRFSDSALNDTVQRVSARTTSKIAERVLASVERGLALEGGEVLKAPTFVTACWLLNLGYEDEFGQEIAMTDADAESLIEPYEQVVTWARANDQFPDEANFEPLREAFAEIGEILGQARLTRLAANDEFILELGRSVLEIHRDGTEKAIEALIERAA